MGGISRIDVERPDAFVLQTCVSIFRNASLTKSWNGGNSRGARVRNGIRGRTRIRDTDGRTIIRKTWVRTGI